MTERKHDIERYLRGEMTASEMHALEVEAMNDPFLADALEGAQHAGTDNFLIDLQDIRSSLTHKHRSHRPKIISMWNWSIGIAAGLILVGLSGLYLISNMKQKAEFQSEQEMNVKQVLHADTLEIQYPLLAERREIAMAKERARLQDQTPAARIETVTTTEIVRHERQREVEANLSEPPTLSERSQPDISTKPLSVTSRVIRGRVTSTEDGSAVTGVNITVDDSREGTITNAYGEYVIRTNSDARQLHFSFIGMKSQDIDIRNVNEINVELTPDYSSLSEVVVTGYASPNENAADDEAAFHMAEPEGGRRAYSKYLENKMSYPKQALEHNIEGKVTIQFTVSAVGQLTDFKVLKGIGFGCDDELIRLVKEGPAWTPSRKGDRPVSDKVKVGLKFNIPEKK